MANPNPLKRTSKQAVQFIEHTSGVSVKKKGGKGTHDPVVTRTGNNLTVTGGALNMDGAAIVQQRAFAPDGVVKDLIKKTGRDINKMWEILEKSRAAYAAGNHTHRPKLLERHKKQVQKQVLENEAGRKERRVAGIGGNGKANIEESLRGLMYGHRVADTDPHAQQIWYQFKDKIYQAVTSPDALDTIRISYKVAELYDWLLEQDEPPPNGCELPTSGGQGEEPQETGGGGQGEPDPETQPDEQDQETGQAPPKPQPVTPPPPLPQSAPKPEDNDEVDTALGGILDPFNTSRKHNPGGIGGETDSGGSAGAGSGATDGGMTITNDEKEHIGQEELREKLKQVFAEKQEQAKQDAYEAKSHRAYGVHDYEVRQPTSKQVEPVGQSDVIKMVLSETRGRSERQIGRRGMVTGRAWQAAAFGNMNVFRKKPNSEGEIVILVDMSGSMGCGCTICSGDVLDMRRAGCQSPHHHENSDPALPINSTAKKYYSGIHTPCTPDPNWTPERAQQNARYLRSNPSPSWLAKQAVSAITERFPTAKVYGFSDGSKTGTVIVPIAHRQWLNDSGRELFGGGTPTCGGLQFLQDAVSGVATNTTAILIMDSGPWNAGNYFKASSKVKICDHAHYAQQCSEFVKRGMGFGIIEVGMSAGSITQQLDVPVGATAAIKSEKDLMNLIPMFSYLDGRNG